MSTILVTGATGTVGAHVVRELLHLGRPVRAFVRDPDAAAATLGDRVELATGDLGDPGSLRRALDGVERVFLCAANHPRQVEWETNVIDVAAEAGVRRLVKLGASGARIGSPFEFADAHGRIEQQLWTSRLPAVVLHPTFYMSNLLADAETITRHGRLYAPAGDAKVAMIDPRDMAAVAAVVLTERGHEGRTYQLTGPVAVTFAEVAADLSTAIGRPVAYVDVPDEAARARMVGSGVPGWLADQLVILWGLLRAGAAATTTDVVRVLTGRDPRSVAEFGRALATAIR